MREINPDIPPTPVEEIFERWTPPAAETPREPAPSPVVRAAPAYLPTPFTPPSGRAVQHDGRQINEVWFEEYGRKRASLAEMARYFETTVAWVEAVYAVYPWARAAYDRGVTRADADLVVLAERTMEDSIRGGTRWREVIDKDGEVHTLEEERLPDTDLAFKVAAKLAPKRWGDAPVVQHMTISQTTVNHYGELFEKEGLRPATPPTGPDVQIAAPAPDTQAPT